MSDKNNRPIVQRIENLINKFIRPSHQVRPTTSHQKENNCELIKNEFIFDIQNEGLTKPKQHSFDYDVYMKCFIHELRTPITTISLGLHILKQNITDAENQQTIDDVKKSVIFIENILTKFTTIQEGNLKLNIFEPFSLSKLIVNVEILIMYNFKESGVSFVYHIDPDVKIWNYGDVHNIKHIMINLLKNAIKYRNNDRKNTITVHITASQNDRQETENQTQIVHISVCDVNNHILPDIKEHIFEAFNTTSGSGMGLYICKSIVELHSGTILHNFIEPVGNEFIFSLPFTICHESTIDMKSQDISRLNSKKYIAENAKKYNILLVDDSLVNLQMMYKILKTVQIFTNIYTAQNGVDALKIITNKLDEISIVLLDKNMPFMDGWECVKHMRTTLSYNKLVIGVTGEDSSEKINGFIQSGVDYVIVKPLDNEKIQQIHLFLIKYGTDRPPDKTIQMVNGQLEWM